MLELKDGFVLYHGSYCEIKDPDLASKEKLNYTIDLLITMVTDEIAEETGKDRKEILTDFLCSKTGKALYDERTKLWCNGPAYIAELYREELKKSGYKM